MKDYRFDFSGKNAIVTGASGVIGGGMAEALIECGANEAMTYNSHREPVEERISHMSKPGLTLRGYKIDYMHPEEIAVHADQVMADFGRIDILVNCAGGHLAGSISDGDLTLFDLDPLVMRDNATFNLFAGCIWPCYYYGRKMLANPEGGSIVNISSMNAYRPLRGRASYAAAKAGVTNFTQWLACHLARDFNPKIRVNCIAPGFFPGPHNRGVMTNEDGSLAWRGREIVAMTPMGRLGMSDDIVGTLLYYVSDLSKYITGTMIPVDGGFTAYAGL
jgi:NAD(P)-dependent dehydrogenase (short-subunit alcohol dehydrogenase family)